MTLRSSAKPKRSNPEQPLKVLPDAMNIFENLNQLNGLLSR